MKDLIGQFIGPDLIKSINKSERTTYMGKLVYDVEFKSGKRKQYPEEILKQIVTKEVSDLSKLQMAITGNVVTQMIVLLAEAELTIDDINFVTQNRLPNTINANTDRANEGYWNKKKEEITLKDVDDKLKELKESKK